MKPEDRFAPLSTAPSLLIVVAAWNFMLSGVANGLLAIMLIGGAKGTTLNLGVLAAAVGLRLAAAGGLFWTGLLLKRGERRGGWLALAFTLLPVLPLLLGAPADWVTILWTVVSLLVLASIWNDLT